MLTIRSAGAAALAAAVLLLPAARGIAAEPTLTDIASCNEQAAARTSGAALPRLDAPAPPPAARGEKSDPTGSIVTDSSDPFVKGMDAQKADDPAYRAAYRECMQRRAHR
jgi:hypothetical protein